MVVVHRMLSASPQCGDVHVAQQMGLKVCNIFIFTVCPCILLQGKERLAIRIDGLQLQSCVTKYVSSLARAKCTLFLIQG